MTKHNPYAPSVASLKRGSAAPDVTGEVRVWRDGKDLIMLHDASLAARCVKCNEPAQDPTKVRTLYWHHPAIYLVILANLIVYVIVAMIVRKKADVDPGLCVRHKKKRTLAITFGWFGVLVGIGSVFAAAASEEPSPGLLLLGVLLFFVSILVGGRMARIVYAKKIETQLVRLRGCGEEYLASHPEYLGD
jgi:hypothetical protein